MIPQNLLKILPNILELRDLAERVRGATDKLEPVDPDREIINVSHLNMSTRERSKRRTKDMIEGVCVHATGVTGGFGASRADLRWAQRQVEWGGEFAGVLHHYSNFMSPVEYRRLVAIVGRYCAQAPGDRGLPYHMLVARSLHAFELNPWDDYTYHGDAANRHYCGFAIDGNFAREALPRDLVMFSRWALAEYIEQLHALTKRPIKVTAHRCFESPRMRGRDPGPEIWSQIVMPVVRELDGMAVMHSVAVNGGRKIPQDWL